MNPFIIKVAIGLTLGLAVALCGLLNLAAKEERKNSRALKYISNFDNHDMEKCVICLDSLTNSMLVRTLFCKHKFHKKCIDEYFSKGNSDTCPLCRRRNNAVAIRDS